MMKLKLQELTHAHGLRCPYCSCDRLNCFGQEKGHGEAVPPVRLQCDACDSGLRLVFETFTDGRIELWLRDPPAVEDLRRRRLSMNNNK
jgi:hypothetical protein